MRRQSTTVRITREVLALMNDYVTQTGNGIIFRWRGQDCGHSNANTMLSSVSGKALSQCTIKKETLAHMVAELASIGFRSWQDRVFRANTGTGTLEGLLWSVRNHAYVPTISGSHWHHHVLMLAVAQSGETYFRGGQMVHPN